MGTLTLYVGQMGTYCIKPSGVVLLYGDMSLKGIQPDRQNHRSRVARENPPKDWLITSEIAIFPPVYYNTYV